MMFALGCIQARRCHTDHCPTGTTTQDPNSNKAVDVETHAPRVANFHARTLESVQEIIGVLGCTNPEELTPAPILMRGSHAQ